MFGYYLFGMGRKQPPIGRREVLSTSVAVLGGSSVSTAVSAATEATQTTTDPEDDPMYVYLSNGYLHVDTSGYGQSSQNKSSTSANSTLLPGPSDAKGGGPGEIPVEDVEAVIGEINAAKNAGDAFLYAYMSDPPIPMVKYDTGPTPVNIGDSGRFSHSCDTTNDIDWNRTWTKNTITITLDKDTAHEVGDMLLAGAAAADVSAVIIGATGVGAVPGWVAGAIGVLVSYWAGDFTHNIGDCGIKQEIDVYGGFPIPFYELSPIHQ